MAGAAYRWGTHPSTMSPNMCPPCSRTRHPPRPVSTGASNENFRDDPSWKLIRQPFVEPVPLVNQITIIHAKEMQDGRMKVVDTDPLLDGLVPQIISRTQRHAASHSAPGHPNGEPAGIMVASGRPRVVPDLGQRHPSKLTAPNDQCAVQQTALLQIFEKSSSRLVGLSTTVTQTVFQVGMGVPDLAFNKDLNETNAPFNEASRHQAALSVGGRDFLVEAIHLLGLFALLREIQSIGRRDLHSGRQLVIGDASIQVRLSRVFLPMQLVQAAQ